MAVMAGHLWFTDMRMLFLYTQVYCSCLQMICSLMTVNACFVW